MDKDEKRRIVLTGAGGFIGSRLVHALLASPDYSDCNFALIDVTAPSTFETDRIEMITGDLTDAGVLDRAFSTPANIVFHLGSILGGAAEADPVRARKTNVDATLDMLERLQIAQNRPRVVFASSVAVFGPDQTDPVDDETTPRPAMVYGCHKRMIEIAIEHMSGRGWIDGLALRLPGIVARRDTDQRLRSAFMNTLFFDFAAGRAQSLPVSADGAAWWLSVSACVACLVHAGSIAPERLGTRRAFTLPAQKISFRALIDGLAQRFPDSGATVAFHPDPDVERQFGRQPDLKTPLADSLGFRHDGNVDALIRRIFE
ncbi:NAD-dependent epimerase/dehydratase family protein [Novosphingobium sp. SG720]|uniref:NAD-dependent epimerase/dehydratase family protein n=1 Tax=Novosphingobium sp. SG720 TaxID=2586998 RepID=UPI001446FD11|nr:NAD-dependent epimerase/dehydratase family protein [Novosphingobium sp. SG720]NKJ44825.1 nucleoside-diphosphate-sugar epimerase [Novosphingobium sp. SG720]